MTKPFEWVYLSEKHSGRQGGAERKVATIIKAVERRQADRSADCGLQVRQDSGGETGSAIVRRARQNLPASGLYLGRGGKPLHLVVDGAANAGRSCRIEFVSEFAPGAHYVIKGGIIESPETYDSCQVKIFDEGTGVPLRMVEPSTLKSNCVLDTRRVIIQEG